MRAVVTQQVGAMAVLDRPEPADPGPGEVVVAPEATGICGSDYHFFTGELSDAAGGSQFPRVQGHEAAARIMAVGPDCDERLAVGGRVALWPLHACGHCYPCSVGRANACDNFSLIGIHADGSLQELLRIDADHAFPIRVDDPAVAAMTEPVSIAVRAVRRGRIAAGERVVVFGAGPIGQALALAATDRGARVLLVDRLESRLAPGTAIGAELLCLEAGEDVVQRAREWAGDDGPEVVIEATGVPELVKPAAQLVAHAGRVVVVGLSGHDAPFRAGDLSFKELDLLGVSCCSADEFAAAVEIVGRRRDAAAPLVTHQFPLEQAPEAMEYALHNPDEVMKAVVRLDESSVAH
jgi:threonine dehydrogenase-like Zn-dependent dehydrogenase